MTYGIRASYGASTNALRDSYVPCWFKILSFFHLMALRGLYPSFLISLGDRCRRKHSGWAYIAPVWIRIAVS
jgi:hypothetical protein